MVHVRGVRPARSANPSASPARRPEAFAGIRISECREAAPRATPPLRATPPGTRSGSTYAAQPLAHRSRLVGQIQPVTPGIYGYREGASASGRVLRVAC